MSIKKNFFAPLASGLGATRRAAMLLLVMMLTTATAWADNVTYFDPTDAVNPTKTAENPTVITSETTEIGTADQTTWYYVSGTFTNYNRIEVKGTVNIILVDGCNFTVSKGIRVASTNALNIWAQKVAMGVHDDCGRLTARHDGYDAAIGGNGGSDQNSNGTDGESSGTITIYGGHIDVTGNFGGANGGKGYSGEVSGTGGNGGDGTIIIRDGHITVEGNLGGGSGGYGQGVISSWTEEFREGGKGGNGGNGSVTINGGDVNVLGDMGGGYQGECNDSGELGAHGSGDVSLSWSKASDKIFAYTYRGTVNLQKPFMDRNEVVYNEGEYENGQSGEKRIHNKWLYPAGTMYDITIGGSYDPACLESSKAHAMEGVEITLTAVNGYKVSSMTVKDADNQDVSLTDNQNGTWTFIF